MHPHFDPQNTNRRPRLLIAEDDPQLLFPLREFFCEQGFTVDCVIGTVEAERMLGRFPYDALLTDLHLSADHRSDGLAVLREAKRAQPAIRAVMMTAYPSTQLEYDARRLGADAVLSKPIALEELGGFVAGS